MKFASIFALTLLAAVPALALNDISWVASYGTDNNGCGVRDVPCRTFAVAVNSTRDYGVVRALDPGDFYPVAITKPITIDGNGFGTILAASSHAVVVLNTTGHVEIRNLAIHVLNACNGCDAINEVNSNLSIENVSITGAPNNGVTLNGGTAAIHSVTVTGAFNGIFVKDATASISDSVLRYSTFGIAVTGATAVTQVLIEGSKMTGNQLGLAVSNNSFAATARISDCVISGNTNGALATGGGQIITLRNNTWTGNTTDGSTPFSISLK
jgi:hypothetical protein